MAQVDNIGNQSIQVTGADIVESQETSTQVLASNQTVTVNVLDPAPYTVPYWDADKNFAPATLGQVASEMVKTPEAENVLEAAAVSAGVNTVYKVATLPNGTTQTVNVADGSYVKINLTNPTTNLLIAPYSDVAGYARQITLEIKQGTGSNKITWPTRISWAEGRQPLLSYLAGRTDFVTLVSSDSGASFKGFFNGGWS